MRCGIQGEGSDFKEASSKINHAYGLSFGKPCGADPKNLKEIQTSKSKTEKKETKPKTTKPKTEKKETITKTFTSKNTFN